MFSNNWNTTWFILILTIAAVQPIRFFIKGNQMKCFRENVPKDVLILGEIEVVEHIALKVDYTVTDSYNNVLSKKEEVAGLFKFSAVMETNEAIEICFRASVTKNLNRNEARSFSAEISLTLSKDEGPLRLNGTAQMHLLKPIELKFQKVERLAQSILTDFRNLLDNESANRRTNESTHFRVFYFSVVSIAILLLLAFWQIIYLKRYFKVKKLIE